MKYKKIFTYLFFLAFHIFWFYLVVRFSDFRLFTVFLPLVIIFNFSKNKKIRNAFISIFVVLWLALFHYESLRTFYLNQLFHLNLPKTKFLFPPAGWIMFYEVDKSGGSVEVFGVKNSKPQRIDPHDIFRTRTIGYDNIQRGIIFSVTDRNPANASQFCRFLNYRFPYFDKFYVAAAYYPDMTKNPYERSQRIMYQCDDKYIRFSK